MSPINTVDEFTETVAVGSNGEGCSETERKATAQSLGNRTHFLLKTLNGGDASSEETLSPENATEFELGSIQIPKLARAGLLWTAFQGLYGNVVGAWNRINQMRSRGWGVSKTAQTMRFPVQYLGGSGWDYRDLANVGHPPHLIQTSTSSQNCRIWVPPFPPGVVISAISINVLAIVAHGPLPVQMPQLSVYAAGNVGILQFEEPSWAQVGTTATDTSANAGQYETVHNITCASLNYTTAVNQWLYLSVRGEGSTNAQANSFLIYSVAVTIDPLS